MLSETLSGMRDAKVSRLARTAGQWSTLFLGVVICVLVASPQVGWARSSNEPPETPFGATAILIELTEDDIELQAFVDGTKWKSVKIFDPNEKAILNVRARGRRLGKQGLSELTLASHPSHYLEDEPNFDEPIDAFLARFPAGVYEFEGRTTDGIEVEGEATLTHVLPALPQIVAPVSTTDAPPVVDRNHLVIEWEPVTTRFIGDGPVEIIEYQVILDPVIEREIPWVDGKTRRALINVPGSITRLTVPPEYLLPDAEYNFEVLAIEASGNSTITDGAFVTSP